MESNTQEQWNAWYNHKSNKERFMEAEEREQERQDEIQENTDSMEEKLEELETVEN